MRQPRFRKRLEKEHIAEQILTKQIISLPLRGWPPLFHFWTGEKREREREDFFLFFLHAYGSCLCAKTSRSFAVWPLLAN